MLSFFENLLNNLLNELERIGKNILAGAAALVAVAILLIFSFKYGTPIVNFLFGL